MRCEKCHADLGAPPRKVLDLSEDAWRSMVLEFLNDRDHDAETVQWALSIIHAYAPDSGAVRPGKDEY